MSLDIINTKEAGNILDCTPDYIRALCADKEKRELIGASKMGKIWILLKDKVEKYAEEREAKKNKKYEN